MLAVCNGIDDSIGNEVILDSIFSCNTGGLNLQTASKGTAYIRSMSTFTFRTESCAEPSSEDESGASQFRWSVCQALVFVRALRTRNQAGNGRALSWLAAVVILLLIPCVGCRMTREQTFRRLAYVASFSPHEVVTVKPVGKKSQLQKITNYFARKAMPSERTELLLRKYSLVEHYRRDPAGVIQWLSELVSNEPTMEEVHGLAELAEIEANWLRWKGDLKGATHYYTTALVHSYQFLFAPRLDATRNAYDPQFRSICDIYNRSLEGLLRQFCKEGTLVPGKIISIGEGSNQFEFRVEITGRWREEEFDRFELASDYETQGLVNRYHTYGLGVPLIAVRKANAGHSAVEQFYPPHLTLPLTAFGHLQLNQQYSPHGGMQAVLTLYDPLEQTFVHKDGLIVPLESNITTPLAYNLRDPVIHSGVLETVSLINAELTPELYGMYMLEPYDANKIPVVMVHGLWSSPMTWVKMFNDLRATPELHAHYQFWFYAYPTGQPFWFSAQQMREDLAKIKQILDPAGRSAPLNEMILVGHSMGGLISTMQTLNSSDRYWKLISHVPLDQLEGEPAALQRVRDTFFFQPNPAISRVITIATPFQGSEFANARTQWFSRKLFTLPHVERNQLRKLVESNGDKIVAKEMLLTATSLDSLESGAPIFDAIEQSESALHVQHHNIYGRTEKKRWIRTSASPEYQGDGVVSLESANNPRALTQLAVEAEHSDLHQNGACIYEVKRILLKNLVELSRIRDRGIPQLPAEVIRAGLEEEVLAPAK
jgi:pimeloyl-ACP methyl ester carboxylesterase